MTDLAIIEARPLDTTDRLSDLADRINQSHQEVAGAISAGLRYAIAAGEALNEAFELVEPGQWEKWCADNVMLAHATRNRYRLIAQNKHLLPPELLEPRLGFNNQWNGGIKQALAYLKQIEAPPVRNRGRPSLVDRDEVRRLHRNGMGKADLAEMFGVSLSTINQSLMNEADRKAMVRRYSRNQRLKSAALKREQNRKSLEATKDDLGEAASHLRRALQRLQLAIDNCSNPNQRKPMNSAMMRLHAAEDFLVKASKERA
jgi:transposase